MITEKDFRDCRAKISSMRTLRVKQIYLNKKKIEQVVYFLKIGCATRGCIAKKFGVAEKVIAQIYKDYVL